MIILPHSPTISLIHSSLKVGRMKFLNLGVKGLMQPLLGAILLRSKGISVVFILLDSNAIVCSIVFKFLGIG